MSTKTRQRAPSPWRNRDYLLLWGGQSVSAVGSRVSSIAFPLLVLELTHSAAQAGLEGALVTLPYALFGLPAGALIDRWNRKRVILVCDAIRAVNIATIPLAIAIGHLPMSQIYLVAFLDGSLFTFSDIAQSASLPRVVSAEQLPAALARSAGTVGITGLIGPPLGGLLYQIGRGFPFLADAISYLSSLVSLVFLRSNLQPERIEPAGSLLTDIREGLVWIGRRPLVRFTGLMAVSNGMVGTGQGLIIIVVARQHHASPAMIGLMFAIASIGGTAGSFLTAPAVRRFSSRQVLTGVLWIEAALWPLYLLTSAPLLLGAITGLIWMVSGPFHLAPATYRRTLLPDALQGRVNSVFELAELAGDAVSVALTGVLLQAAGIRWSLLVLLAWLLVQAAVTTGNRHVRNAPPLTEKAPAGSD